MRRKGRAIHPLCDDRTYMKKELALLAVIFLRWSLPSKIPLSCHNFILLQPPGMGPRSHCPLASALFI
jgi:hypothetical protein